MLKRYGFWGLVRVLVSLLYTKIYFKNARLIRLPFDIRNRRFIEIGKSFTSGIGCRLEAHQMDASKSSKVLIIGEHVQVNDYIHIAAGEKVQIGNHVLIASKVFITDINHGLYQGEQVDSPLVPPNDRQLSTNPVFIEDNVWLGENVCVMPGTTIGFGSIIGASSVVTKSIPAHCIAVGNPARVIKVFNMEKQRWDAVVK